MHMMADAYQSSSLRRVTPRVSIGMPVYNGERFVTSAIESLLGQTFGDFELIICDNASTDNTESICRDFAGRDRRVHYQRNDHNIGAAGNFNRAFELGAAPYFKWAAADDMHAPRYLERCVAVLDADPSVCLSHSQTLVIDENGKALPKPLVNGNGHASQCRDANWDDECFYDPPRRLDSTHAPERFREILLQTRWCFEIFGLMRRDCVAGTALHESYYGSDKVLLSAMSLKGRFIEVPEALFFRRYHGGTSTSLKSAREREAWMNPTAARKASALGAFPVMPRVKCLQGYCKSIAEADHLAMTDQALCFAAVGSYLVQPNKWAALMREPA